jgi:hypothetical protein
MRRRRAISSIYGFIMIFLLSMASIQTWSSAVGSMASIDGASEQGHQLQEMQSIERLALSESGGNLTITNDGSVSSTILYLRLVGNNDSKSIPLDVGIPVGGSLTEPVSSVFTVEVVTSLGNVFVLSRGADPLGSVWAGGTVLLGGPNEAQIFRSPFDSSSFYLAEGPGVYAFSVSGSLLWSFDSGVGFVTDVLPLQNGDVYVSVGYQPGSNNAELFELSSDGTVMATYSVRLLETPSGPAGDPSFAVTKGDDASYAFYDGWFYSQSGPVASLASDASPLAGSDALDFYFYNVNPVPYEDGTCQPPGNELVVSSYTASPVYAGSLKMNWQSYLYFGTCNKYPEQLVSSAVYGGVAALLFASPAFAASPAEAYPAQNPYLAIVSSSGGDLYVGSAPDNGYTSVVTNGTEVYMALPQAEQIQVYSLHKGTYSTISIGMHASQLTFINDTLFAISNAEVKVFSSSMTLEKTIDFAPLSLASSANSDFQEPALDSPSFLILNATTYAVLLLNSTGYTSLALGRYS